MVKRGDRKDPAERRLEIMETALSVADTQGLDRLTSRDVAAAMDVTPGLVHHYFPSMDELIGAAFAHFANAELLKCQKMLEELPALPALRAYLWRLHDTNRSTAARLWMGAWIAASRRAELAAEVDRQMQADQRLLCDLLARGVAEGSFVISDARKSANRILALWDGVIIQISVRGVAGTTTFSDIDDLVWEMVEREVGLTEGALSNLVGAAPGAAPRAGVRTVSRRRTAST